MRQKKIIFFKELAYAVGLVLISLSVALMTKLDMGVSMVVAPAYLIHLKVSEFLPFFTFGMSGYVCQLALLLCLMGVIRTFKLTYFFSFVTAFLSGVVLDLFLFVLSPVSFDTLWVKILVFAVAATCCCAGVALMFRTYIPPEVYDLTVKELIAHFHFNGTRCKLIYDLTSLTLALVLSVCFFGIYPLRGIGIATVITAFINGPLIGFFGKLYERLFVFERGFDRLKKRT